MTPENKTKIKELMQLHLKKLGWPQVANSDQLVLNEVESMFRVLLKRNLVSYADYEQFYLAAVHQYNRSQLTKSEG